MKVTKFIDENFLCEMAMPLDKAKKNIGGNGDVITPHIIKCIVYPDSIDLSHWIKEIANLFKIINVIELKPHNTKLKYENYADLVFGDFGSPVTRIDCWSALNSFRSSYVVSKEKYKNFQITDNLVDQLYNFVFNLSKEAINIFVTKNNLTMDDFEEIIRKNLSLIEKN